MNSKMSLSSAAPPELGKEALVAVRQHMEWLNQQALMIPQMSHHQKSAEMNLYLYDLSLKISKSQYQLANRCVDLIRSIMIKRALEPQQNREANQQRDIWSHDAERIIPPNTECAALVDSSNWIRARIKGYIPGPKPKYDVVDVDAESSYHDVDSEKTYRLDPSKVIPVYSLAEYPMTQRRIFPAGTRVLALFPSDDVTVFYLATVLMAPKPKSKHPQYTLQFEEDEDTTRTVQAHFVAPYPENLG